jgi:hypothetical protein
MTRSQRLSSSVSPRSLLHSIAGVGGISPYRGSAKGSQHVQNSHFARLLWLVLPETAVTLPMTLGQDAVQLEPEADTARLGPGSRAAYFSASVTASRRLQFATRCGARHWRQPPCRFGFGTWALAVQLTPRTLGRPTVTCEAKIVVSATCYRWGVDDCGRAVAGLAWLRRAQITAGRA